MDEITNRAELCGTVAEAPVFSHESRGIRFYSFPFTACRLSGAADTVNILVRESLLLSVAPQAGDRLRIAGQLRSFNNKSGVGARLVITIYAQELYPAACEEDENLVELIGTICKPPILRRTPLGREICDIILAVPRRYSRSDYIPVITWGNQAHDAALCPVGQRMAVKGRIQSRSYTKLIDGIPMERTAFELSAAEVEFI